MTSFAKPIQSYMPSLPFYGSYQQINDQSTPLYHQSPPMPQYQQPTAYDPKSPIYEPTSVQPQSPGISKTRKLYNKYRLHLKIIGVVSTVLSLLLALVMETVMIYTIIVFETTKNKTATDKAGDTITPWGLNIKEWPTYLLLVASTVTLFGCVFELVRGCCCGARKRTMFNTIYYFIHVVVWVGVAVFYRVGKTGKDLWGWSCDMEGGPRQQLFKDELHFDMLCRIQTNAWITSIAEGGIKLIFTIGGYLYSKRLARQQAKVTREMGQFEQPNETGM